MRQQMNNIKYKSLLKTLIPYACVVFSVVCIFLVLYRDANLRYPLLYTGGDDSGVYYIVKSIRDYGITLENSSVGGLSGGNMYDYYYCSNLSFLIVKLISLFTKDIYLITNMFYLSCFVLSGVTAYYASNKLLNNSYSPFLVALLYSFSFFLQVRYTHLWLCPYYMMPLVCLVAIWIARGEIFENENSSFDTYKYWVSIAISVFAAGTGLYYAFFACALYAIAFVLNIVNGRRTAKDIFLPLVFIVTTVVSVVINLAPNFVYFAKNGFNTSSEAYTRPIGDVEYYGLKMVQMVIPRTGHRVGFLADISEKYVDNFPLISENVTASVGLVSTIGLVISVLWLFKNKKKDKTLSYLIISLFFIGTIGGISSIIALFVSLPVRSYNRLSVVIMFLALVVFSSFIDELLANKNKYIYVGSIAVICAIGLFDQTSTYSGQKSAIDALNSDRAFICEIEKHLEPGDYVFELPVLNWPSESCDGKGYSLFNGYLASDTLNWSYGAPEWREEAFWQKKVSSYSTEEFLTTIEESGYDGLYFDYSLYGLSEGLDEADFRLQELEYELGAPDVINSSGTIYFWKLD